VQNTPLAPVRTGCARTLRRSIGFDWAFRRCACVTFKGSFGRLSANRNQILAVRNELVLLEHLRVRRLMRKTHPWKILLGGQASSGLSAPYYCLIDGLWVRKGNFALITRRAIHATSSRKIVPGKVGHRQVPSALIQGKKIKAGFGASSGSQSCSSSISHSRGLGFSHSSSTRVTSFRRGRYGRESFPQGMERRLLARRKKRFLMGHLCGMGIPVGLAASLPPTPGPRIGCLNSARSPRVPSRSVSSTVRGAEKTQCFHSISCFGFNSASRAIPGESGGSRWEVQMEKNVASRNKKPCGSDSRHARMQARHRVRRALNSRSALPDCSGITKSAGPPKFSKPPLAFRMARSGPPTALTEGFSSKHLEGRFLRSHRRFRRNTN